MPSSKWPADPPDNEDVAFLSKNTSTSANISSILSPRRVGLAPGLKPLESGVTLHQACHARAQNMGQKGTELLRLIPEPDVAVVERCSGHGDRVSRKGNFEKAMKVGKPVARQAAKNDKAYLASECPLAGMHVVQGIEAIEGTSHQSASGRTIGQSLRRRIPHHDRCTANHPGRYHGDAGIWPRSAAISAGGYRS